MAPRPALYRRWKAVTLSVLLPLAAPGMPLAGAAAPEPTVKRAAIDADTATAAYLINFLRFTTWPESAQPRSPAAPYVIGVSCSDALLNALITMTDGQSVHGHPVRAIRIKNVADFATCHLAYLNCTEECGPQDNTLPASLKALQGLPVLTVSPQSDFLANGGQVQLFHAESRLRFSISVEATRAVGLTLSSRLLILSRPVPSSL